MWVTPHSSRSGRTASPQALAHAAVRVGRVDGERPEDGEAAPAGEEGGADYLAAALGDEGGFGGEGEAAADELRPLGEPERVGKAHPCSEGEPEDTVRGCEVALLERAHDDVIARPPRHHADVREWASSVGTSREDRGWPSSLR